MLDLLPILQELVSHAEPQGGWAYRPGQLAQVEPTCLALLALGLAPEPFQEPIAQARAVLDSWLGPDGRCPPRNGRQEAVWPTSLVLLVQTAFNAPRDKVNQIAASLLAVEGRRPGEADGAELHDIDAQLIGWPWAENNFSWVEPTAWACLALRRAGFGEHPRVKEGLRLLLDRAADDGGINYGNRSVFGRRTEAQMEPSALMLLALQGHGHEPRVAATVDYLRQHALTAQEVDQLAFAKLALQRFQDVPGIAEALPQIDQRLIAAYERRKRTSWLKPAPLRIALTALALAAGTRHAFALSQERGTEALAPRTPRTQPTSISQHVASRLRGFLLRGAARLRSLPPHTAVHIAQAADYNAGLARILREQFNSFRPQLSLTGKRVVLKPNLVEYHRDKVINTNPLVIAAAIELCRSEGAAEIIVAEGPGHCRNVEFLVQASGLGEVLDQFGVPFVDLNHDEPVKTLNLGRLTGLDYLYLSRTIVSADVLISMPKLKTHHWAGATLSLKNLFGTLPGICYGWPKNELHWRGIDNSIIDIALTRPPDLAIVDGIIGMEGDGPLNGTPKALGALVMGLDPLAVDATCCRLMRLDVTKIGYLNLGHQRRLGLLREEEIHQVGLPIDSLAQPFAMLPHLHNLCVNRSA